MKLLTAKPRTSPMKPANKAELGREIAQAMTPHGNTVDLNYIDTSGIT